jgi:hypothetical protein
VLLTRSPLYSGPEGPFPVRLACVRHAASVDSEPGSNSHIDLRLRTSLPNCQRTLAGPAFAFSRPARRYDTQKGVKVSTIRRNLLLFFSQTPGCALTSMYETAHRAWSAALFQRSNPAVDRPHKAWSAARAKACVGFRHCDKLSGYGFPLRLVRRSAGKRSVRRSLPQSRTRFRLPKAHLLPLRFLRLL